jgi:hypothetical protein
VTVIANSILAGDDGAGGDDPINGVVVTTKGKVQSTTPSISSLLNAGYKVQLARTDTLYKGSPVVTPTFTVVDAGGFQIANAKWTGPIYSQSAGTWEDAGDYEVTVSGSNTVVDGTIYKGDISATFTINPKPITHADIAIANKKTKVEYSGSRQPAFTAVDDYGLTSTTLTEGTDYEVEYYGWRANDVVVAGRLRYGTNEAITEPDFIHADSMIVLIRGIGNYGAEYKWSYYIQPKALTPGTGYLPTRYDTLEYNGLAQTLLIAPDSLPSFPTGASGTIQYSTVYTVSPVNNVPASPGGFTGNLNNVKATNAGTYCVFIKWPTQTTTVANAGNVVIPVGEGPIRDYIEFVDSGYIYIKATAPQITWPANSAQTYSPTRTLGSLSTSLSGGSVMPGNPSICTFNWTNPGRVPQVSTTEYSMTLNISGLSATDSANYDWKGYADTSQYVTWYPAGDSLVFSRAPLTITPATCSWNVPPSIPTSAVYIGDSIEVVTSGTGTAIGGDVYWEVTGPVTTWSSSTHRPKLMDAASYTITAYIKATSPNYADLGSASSPDYNSSATPNFQITAAPLEITIKDEYLNKDSATSTLNFVWTTMPSKGFVGIDAIGTNYITVLGGTAPTIALSSTGYGGSPFPATPTYTTGNYSNAIEFSTALNIASNTEGSQNYTLTVNKGTLIINAKSFIGGSLALDNLTPHPTEPITVTWTPSGQTGEATAGASLTYEWYVGGSRVQSQTTSDTTNSYSPSASDVGKLIEVVVSAGGYNGNLTLTSSAVTLLAYPAGYPHPDSADTLQVTPHLVELKQPSNEAAVIAIGKYYEYSMDLGPWQTNRDFTFPTSTCGGTSHTFYQRIASTGGMQPSDTTNIAVVLPTLAQWDFDKIIKPWLEGATYQDVSYVTSGLATTATDAATSMWNNLSSSIPTTGSNVQITNITVDALSGSFPTGPLSATGTWTGIEAVVSYNDPCGNSITNQRVALKDVKIVYSPYSVTISSISDGTVVPAVGVHPYGFGAQVVVTATPNFGKKVISWTLSGIAASATTQFVPSASDPFGTPATVSFTMPGNAVTVQANYATDQEWLDSVAVASDVAELINGVNTDLLKTSQTTANTQASYESVVRNIVNGVSASHGVTTAITFASFKAPTKGDESNPDGVNGYLDFIVTVSKGNATSQTTGVIRLVITATPYITAQAPKIYRQPQYNQVVYYSGNGVVTLSVDVTSPDGGQLTYRWYRNTVESSSGGTAITGTAGAGNSLKVVLNSNNTGTRDTIGLGTYYYYVVITNTKTGVNPATSSTTISSNVAVINVRPVITQSNFMRPVNIKDDNVGALATVSPRYGVHWIPSRSDFVFTVHANEGYDLSGLTVKTDVPLDVTIEKSPAEIDGAVTTATVTIKFVNLEVNVTLDGVALIGGTVGGAGGGETTGNAAIANGSLKVWSLEGDLYISGLPQGKAYSVYNIAGKLIYQGISSAGKTEHVRIPAAGIYLLKTDDKTVKAVVK